MNKAATQAYEVLDESSSLLLSAIGELKRVEALVAAGEPSKAIFSRVRAVRRDVGRLDVRFHRHLHHQTFELVGEFESVLRDFRGLESALRCSGTAAMSQLGEPLKHRLECLRQSCHRAMDRLRFSDLADGGYEMLGT